MADQNLLSFLDRKPNDLMQALFRNRQVLTELQPNAASMLARIGEAMVTNREQERTLADVRRHVNSLRQAD